MYVVIGSYPKKLSILEGRKPRTLASSLAISAATESEALKMAETFWQGREIIAHDVRVIKDSDFEGHLTGVIVIKP